MIAALAFWVAISVLAGLLVGFAFRAGAEDRPCNQNCRQGRDCTCRVPTGTQP